MKNNDKQASKKKIAIISGLSALCVAVLAGVCFLKKEPETDFTPASSERADVTDTWEENSGTDVSHPDTFAEGSSQLQGNPSDNTQTVVTEDESGSTTSLSDSSTKEETLPEKPTEPPVTTDDISDPDKQPEYDPPAQQTPAPAQDDPNGGSGTGTPAGGTGSDDSHPRQVYDPVFGWIDVGNTQQDNIDSDGDINNQIGSMGGN